MTGLSAPALAALEEGAALSRELRTGLLLVGGAVRDLLLGRPQPDLDLVVEAKQCATFARELAARLDAELREHPVYLTAKIRAQGVDLDLAAARAESYSSPGALPTVRPASLDEDLRRRDFTLNSLAVRLGPNDWGGLIDPCGGLADLRRLRLRFLHRRSFEDDPTRILRAVELEARLGARMEGETEAAAKRGLDEGVLVPLSGERLRQALWPLLASPRAGTHLGRLRELGFWRALEPELAGGDCVEATAETLRATSRRFFRRGPEVRPQREIAPETARSSREPDPALLQLLALSVEASAAGRARVAERLALAPAAGRILAGCGDNLERAETVLGGQQPRPHVITAALAGLSAEELVLLAAGGGAARNAVTTYLEEHRDLRLGIGGADLVALGFEPGPRIGHALRATCEARIDGVIGAADELDHARSLLESGDGAEEDV